MSNSNTNIIFLLFFQIIAQNIVFAQDTIPTSSELDSVINFSDTLLVEDSITIADSLNIDTTNRRFEDKVVYKAQDSIVVRLDEKKMFLFNQSRIEYTSMTINANYIELDMGNEIITASGTKDTAGNEIGLPVFNDKDEKYDSRIMKYNYKTKKGYIEQIVTEDQGGYVLGDKTKKVDDKNYFISNAKYTTCELHDYPHYYIKLRKAKLLKEKGVYAWGFGLVIEDVTTMYLPLPLYIPTKKKYSSGIIFPSYGEEKRRGFFYRDLGFYWAASDYFDLKLSNDFFTNGSWGFKIYSNYKKRYKFSGNLDIQYFRNKFGDESADDFTRSKDISISWSHRQDPKAHPYRNISASVSISTSENDYNNAQNLRNIVNNKKHSSIAYTRRWPNSPFSLGITLRHSQNSLNESMSLTLPDISLNMTTIYPFRPKNRAGKLKWSDKISIGYSTNIRNSINTHEDKVFESNLLKEWKNGARHSIPIGGSFNLAPNLQFSPSFNYNSVMYLKSISKSYDQTNNQVVIDTLTGFNYAHSLTASASLSYNPRIYGLFTFNPKSKIKAIRHVLSPSISISYTPEIDIGEDKYFETYNNPTTNRDIEYSIFEQEIFGTPRSGFESANINFSLDNNLEMKVAKNDTTEVEKIKLLESFRVSASYNLLADSMGLSRISLSGRTSLFKRLISLNFSGSLDPYAINDNGRRINEFHGLLGRLTNFSVSLGANFSSKNKSKNENESVVYDPLYSNYVDFDIPWNFSLGYNLRYSKPTTESTISQNLRVTGGLSLTQKWKLTFNTGYDFDNHEVTATQFSIHRNLHCWEMSFSAIPFGTHQSFSFQINVKSTILKDLKYSKRDSWYDNVQ